jgi:hypothetical protein
MTIPHSISAPAPVGETSRFRGVLLPLRRYMKPLVGLAVSAAAAALAVALGPAEQGYFDSAFYVDGARHLARGDGYVSAFVEVAGKTELQPVTHWAPGISLMMTPFIWLGAPPLTAAAIVVGASYVAGALLLFMLGASLFGAHAWPLGIALSALYTLQSSTRVWLDALLSDLPWATFALLSVWLGLRVMRSPEPSLGLRVMWGLSLWWVVLVRYAGLLFLPGVVGAVALGMRAPGPFWKRPLRLWAALLPAVLGIGLWNLRNTHVADRPLGGWLFVNSELGPHLSLAADSVWVWMTEAEKTAATLGLQTPLYWLMIAGLISLLPLIVCSVRSHWRELLLVWAAGGGYFCALVFAASVTVIAKLSETRFWIVTWPLTWLAILLVVSTARPRWCLPFKAIVLAWLCTVLCMYAYQTHAEAPAARRARGTLDPAWTSAANLLPGPETCTVLVNDPRPLMLHRELPATGIIPTNMRNFEAAVRRSKGKLCLATTDATKRMRLSSSAERRRRKQAQVIDALNERKRLKRLLREPGITIYLVN